MMTIALRAEKALRSAFFCLKMKVKYSIISVCISSSRNSRYLLSGKSRRAMLLCGCAEKKF